jgi:hypothetical protein
MPEKCTSDCSSCSQNCADRKKEKTSFQEKPHELSHIKKVIRRCQRQGRRGQVLVTSCWRLPCAAWDTKPRYLTPDVTGPSIPRAFGLHERASGSEMGLFPVSSQTGIPVMSLEPADGERQPIRWCGGSHHRGYGQAVLDGRHLGQTWTLLFVDMPQGTGVVP